MRVGSNVGKGQMKAVDYVLVPDIANQNANSKGRSLGGMLGGRLGAVVRDLEPGMTLYPTGEKSGIWWKVSDELGNEGWAPSPLFGLAK